MFIEGCPAAVWGDLPRPDLPLTVGLDGGYVHSAHQRSRRVADSSGQLGKAGGPMLVEV